MFDSGLFITSDDGNMVSGAIRVDGERVRAQRVQIREEIVRDPPPRPEDTLQLGMPPGLRQMMTEVLRQAAP